MNNKRIVVLPWVIWAAFAIGLTFGLALYSGKVFAIQLDHEGCKAYAVWTHDIPLMRDVGADKDKVRAYLESKRQEHQIFALLVREFERLWAIKDRDSVMQQTYRDCVGRRGQYGTEV